ncbi:MAG: hypothetical protein NTU73_04320 [Ignavibacteriae bacterium]|nr:hypothetical protein [Ignavibacteriota bacterium]
MINYTVNFFEIELLKIKDIKLHETTEFNRNGFHVAGTNISWERFIVRLAAHGPVTQYVPASILQIRRTDFFIKEVLAENV